jgi:hypothetical protein
MGLPHPDWPRHGLSCEPIPRVAFDSDEPARFVERGRPFVTRPQGWRALEWDVPYLKRTVGDRSVTLLRSDRTSHAKLTISEVLDIVSDERRKAEFVFPGTPYIRIWRLGGLGLNPELSALYDDLKLPSYIPEASVSSINLWASHGFKDNGNHADPNAMANLNLQIQGRKQVWLFAPSDAPCFDMESSLMSPPYVAIQPRANAVGDSPRFKEARCFEAVLEPGDAVYIPPFWFHWFVHFPVYQLNLNIWFERDQHLNPISATWAFTNALARALGGFAPSEEAFEKLPEETKQLLRAIESNLLNETAIYSAGQMNNERIAANPARVPDPSSGEYKPEP